MEPPSDISQLTLVRFSISGYQEPVVKEITYEGYLRQMTIALGLNPQKVRDRLRERGIICNGHWPNQGTKEKLVTVRSFVNELLDNNGNSTLCFLKQFDHAAPNFEVEVGTPIGLFDATMNQGSGFEMVSITSFNCKLWSHCIDEGNGFALNDYV